MNPCHADWVDNSVAKLTKSFEKKLFWVDILWMMKPGDIKFVQITMKEIHL